MAVKICLDPGHTGKQNLGLKGYYESVGNLAACKELKAELESYGFEVFMTRTADNQDPSISTQRGQMAVKNGCQVFISWHSDANANSSVRGVTAIRSIKRPDSYELGKQLAAAVAGAMNTSLSPYSGSVNGVWTRQRSQGDDYYAVLRGATGSGSAVQHAFLIEHGFHTNAQDVAMLDNSARRLEIVKAEAKVLAAWFGLLGTAVETDPGTKFRLYNSVYANVDFKAANEEYKAAKAKEPLVKFRACDDKKFRIYAPSMVTLSPAKAQEYTGPDTLALLEG